MTVKLAQHRQPAAVLEICLTGQKDCLCFTHPTFMRALCSKPLGFRIVFLASGVAGGDMDRLISSREGPWGELGRAEVETQE